MDPEPQLAESTAIDRAFAAAERRKSEGTTAFKDGAFEDAAAHYQGALTLAASCTESAENAVPKRLLLLSLRLNCAAALLKIGQPADALEHCEAALVLDQCSTKALYRKGQALLELAQPALARSTLMDAYKLAPKDKQIRVLLHKADVAAKEVKAKRQSRLFRALVSASPLPSEYRLATCAVCEYTQYTPLICSNRFNHHRPTHPTRPLRRAHPKCPLLPASALMIQWFHRRRTSQTGCKRCRTWRFTADGEKSRPAVCGIPA